MQRRGLLLAAGLASTGAQGESSGLSFVCEPFPPFNEVGDGRRPSGLLVEMVRRLCQQGADCGAPLLRVLPFKRALLETAERPGTAMIGLYRHPDRESQYRWVGPLYEARQVLFARRGAGIRLQNLDQARAYRIGVQENSSHHLFLKGQGFARLEVNSANDARTSSTTLQMLLAGRFELWLATYESALAKAELAGEDPQALEVALTVQHQGLWLALHPQTPDALVADWQRRVRALRRSPEYAVLLQRFIRWRPARK